MSLALLAPFFQDDGGGAAALGTSFVAFCCAGIVALLMIASLWKIFVKAGQPGWAAIIPIYGQYITQQIVGREVWWLAILIFLGPVWTIVISLDLAKSFGKDTLFAVGLILLPVIFYPLLGFGDAQYLGPKRAF